LARLGTWPKPLGRLSVELAVCRPLPGNRPPLVGFACLAEFEDDGAIAPIGLACSLHAVDSSPLPFGCYVDLDFEVFTPSSVSTRLGVEHIPLSDLAPLQGMTNTAPQSLRRRVASVPTEVSTVALTAALALAPSRGLFPFSVFPAAVSYLNPVNTQFTGYVASSGFRTLSTLCSHRSLPGLFHPGPALGVSLRGLDPPTTPYVLSNAESLRVNPLRSTAL
jgi:hypothetical protein